jgi:hypothetical protein
MNLPRLHIRLHPQPITRFKVHSGNFVLSTAATLELSKQQDIHFLEIKNIFDLGRP